VLRRRSIDGLRMQVTEAALPEAAPRCTSTEVAWHQFRDRLRSFVGRRVGNPADADDIVQIVFLRMHGSLTEIRSGERIHAWLYGTARRAIADYYRSPSRRREVPSGDALDLDDLGPVGPEPFDGESDRRREVASCLAPVVTRLSRADQEAIRLTETEGLPFAEAAARSGLSLAALKSRAVRARRRLRQAMLDCCHIALDARNAPIDCAAREQAPPCPGSRKDS
jgi:RNA polymerase sigma-70 factor, ECF subfamily